MIGLAGVEVGISGVNVAVELNVGIIVGVIVGIAESVAATIVAILFASLSDGCVGELLAQPVRIRKEVIAKVISSEFLAWFRSRLS